MGRYQGKEIYIHVYINHNFDQSIRHIKNHQQFLVAGPVPGHSPKVFLKNFSGVLTHHPFVAIVDLDIFEKQINGIYRKVFIPCFKWNVKKIKSNDFEYYVQDVQYILKTNED